ncbi:MAG: hypothetical protein ABSG84_00915 [Acidobacteriaceae bacterium]
MAHPASTLAGDPEAWGARQKTNAGVSPLAALGRDDGCFGWRFGRDDGYFGCASVEMTGFGWRFGRDDGYFGCASVEMTGFGWRSVEMTGFGG